MPISITEDGIFVGDGKGGLKRAETILTKVKITIPGQETILIEDENGIKFEVDETTGLPIVHAEHIEIESEKESKNLIRRFFRRKEG